MEQIWPALLTGTVIGAVVTGAITLLKPVVDYWISVLSRRWTREAQRKAVVEGVVDRIRALRVDHQRAMRDGDAISFDLVLEASDSALLIHDRAFAKYLSLDIENSGGYGVLYDWYEQTGQGDGDGTVSASQAARTARWEHLKTLVARASEFAVTGKWDSAWATRAESLSKEMDEADAAIYR